MQPYPGPWLGKCRCTALTPQPQHAPETQCVYIALRILHIQLSACCAVNWREILLCNGLRSRVCQADILVTGTPDAGGWYVGRALGWVGNVCDQ